MVPSRRTADAEGDHVAAQRIKASLLRHVADIVEECGARALFVYADALEGTALDLPPSIADRVHYVAKTSDEDRQQEDLHVHHLRVPNVALSRMGQVKLVVFLALARGIVRRGDVVAFLTGTPASGTLDTLVVTEVGREFEMSSSAAVGGEDPLPVQPEVLEQVIEIATAIGSEGREGRSLGALFVVGDTERVLSLSRQLILNPFRGYPEEQRNVLDPHITETVKELATIDGAFIIQDDGVIVSAGTYLKTASQDEHELPKGLGARHHAAAGITAVSKALAIVVSQSTGTVMVFRDGRIATSIERPRAPSA